MNADKKERIKKLLNSDMVYLILVSLISADSNYSVETISGNLEVLRDYKEALSDEEFVAEINNGEMYKDMIDKGILILERDLEIYKKEEKEYLSTKTEKWLIDTGE